MDLCSRGGRRRDVDCVPLIQVTHRGIRLFVGDELLAELVRAEDLGYDKTVEDYNEAVGDELHDDHFAPENIEGRVDGIFTHWGLSNGGLWRNSRQGPFVTFKFVELKIENGVQ